MPSSHCSKTAACLNALPEGNNHIRLITDTKMALRGAMTMTMITIWWLQKSAKDCNKQANHSQKAKQYEVKEQYQIRISGKVCSLI